MGFKTQVFNLQVLTQTEFENPQESYFRPKKGQFLVYFNMASKLLMSVVWFKLVTTVHMISATTDQVGIKCTKAKE